jgi:acetolactate synthase-1/2/3 large subunit
VRTPVASDVEVCFANPGTWELHFVAALDKTSGMRAILCLFEGVVTGAPTVMDGWQKSPPALYYI